MKKMYYLILGRGATFTKSIFIASLLFYSIFSFGQGGSLVCNGLVQVSLNIDCEAQINPDMILEGSYDSLNLFSVQISGVTGDVVTQPGEHTVTVTDMTTGNNCWGNIIVEDKLPPIIENCPCAEDNTDPECQFLCSDLEGILNGTIAIPTPDVIENCGSYETLIQDDIDDYGCGGKLLKRTYRYKDEHDNVSQLCETYLYLVPITIGDITPPVKHVNMPCSAGTTPEEVYDYFEPLVGVDSAMTLAYPTINGQIISNTGPCNLIATKHETSIFPCGASCSSSVKIARTWSIIDWCADISEEFTQVVSTKDLVPPTIQGTDLTTSVNPWNCAADIDFPKPIVLHDDCADTVRYEIAGPVGVSFIYSRAKDQWTAQDVPKGIHEFYYRAIDCCGNVGIDTVKVTVVDKSSPVAISKEFVVISLTKEHGENGIAKLYPASIDNGSHDGCTDVHLEIRREGNDCGHEGNNTYNDDGHPFDDPNDPDDGNFVKFCCEDITDISDDGVPFGRVKVWLRVWDDGDMDGTFGTAGDNYNETWSWVRVEDKLPPSIECPDDVTIECYDSYDDLAITGFATASFTCSQGQADYEDIDMDLTSCGIGTVTRRWFVNGYENYNCIQHIEIESGDFFDPQSIVWPQDDETTCDMIDSYQVTWNDAPCALIGLSVDSDTFQFTDNACLKIINTYTLVDWCVYDPNSGTTEGMWSHTQIVKVQDDTKPTITCTDTMFVADDISDADNDGITCELNGFTLSNSAADEGDCSSKWLKWVIYVDLWGDGVSEYEFSSYLSSNDNTFDDDNNNGVPDIYVPATNSYQDVTITIPDGIAGSMNNHKVTWTVTDGCGNKTSCTSIVMVVDKKKPTPYCISLSSAVMDNGTVELWARDFDQGSFDNCTDEEDLLFTLYNEKPVQSKIFVEHYFKGDGLDATEAEYLAGDAQKWVPEFNSSSKIFDCDDLPIAEVMMTVWDEKGEYDFCEVTLTLVDNQDACNDSIMRVDLEGRIQDISGNAMPDVKVSLINDVLPGYPRSNYTDEEGIYSFVNQPSTLDYSIAVEKDGDYMNGVSTLDLVLIQRHILGLEKFDDPYKVIASDINNDAKVRTSDLVELRKLILGVNNAFENNTSWRFIDKEQLFSDPNDPWPFNEIMFMSALDPDKDNIHFYGQKIGDVNNSAKANIKDGNAVPRSPKTLSLWAVNQPVMAGETVTIGIKSPTAIQSYGMQFTLGFDGLVFETLRSEVFDLNSDNYAVLPDGSLVVSVSSPSLIDVEAGDPVFYVTAKVKQQGLISDMININSGALNAEAYLSGMVEHIVQLSFVEIHEENQTGFVLMQNEPNPFSEKTAIQFSIPEDGVVVMSLFDFSGKLVSKSIKDYDKGSHTLVLQKDQFPHNGVYYCKVDHNNNSSIIKMIHLK